MPLTTSPVKLHNPTWYFGALERLVWAAFVANYGVLVEFLLPETVKVLPIENIAPHLML